MNMQFISKDTLSRFDNDMKLLDRYHRAITLLDMYHLSGIIEEKEHTRIREILDSPDYENIAVGEAILENYKNQ